MYHALGDIAKGRGWTCGEQGVHGNFVLSSQFCWEPKTVFENKVY